MTDALSTQTVIDALSTERRRRTIRTLDAAGAQTIRTLAETLAAQVDGDGYDSDARKRIYISLYQVHLPALDKLGVVEWSGNSRDAVTPTERLAVVIEVLDAIEAANTPDATAETGIAGFLTGVLTRDGDGRNAEVITGP